MKSINNDVIDAQENRVLEGFINILAGGGLLFTIASLLIFFKNPQMSNFGFAIAFGLFVPKIAWILSNYRYTQNNND